MTLMHIRDLLACSEHNRAIVVLEDAEQRCRLAIYVSPHEAHRIAHELGRARCAGTPVYDFIQALMDAVDAPMTHVVLDDTGAKASAGPSVADGLSPTWVSPATYRTPWRWR